MGTLASLGSSMEHELRSFKRPNPALCQPKQAKLADSAKNKQSHNLGWNVPKLEELEHIMSFVHAGWAQVKEMKLHDAVRDSGNDFRFPDIGSYTCRFRLIKTWNLFISNCKTQSNQCKRYIQINITYNCQLLLLFLITLFWRLRPLGYWTRYLNCLFIWAH